MDSWLDGVSIIMGFTEPKPVAQPYTNMGNGFELRPIEFFTENNDPIDNVNKYSYLYKDGVQISNKVFRKGGLGGKFKDGYCELIAYEQIDLHTEKQLGFDPGVFVIIDSNAEIVLQSKTNYSDHPYHIGGRIAYMGNYIYDLITGVIIAPLSSDRIHGKKAVIIKHKYNIFTKGVIDLPLGIYSISYATGEIILIDEIE